MTKRNCYNHPKRTRYGHPEQHNMVILNSFQDLAMPNKDAEINSA
jgi:ribosomal protein L32E